ncbi:cupin domain-containing protein [Nocardioides halotolerans]|uniref:cupin domain-containing protein n=1 Tax=Nocardioides halotolerans TaxID=433660 RepID=UPI00042664ED|nr:cupin domain-containing protein [Nocardioides halotolerans]
MTLWSETVSSLDDLYVVTDRLDVTPGWVNRSTPIFWDSPRTAFVPARWHYDEVRRSLDDAGRLIDVELAERRNLVLRNPHTGNDFATTRGFACAYQMILPQEVAPTHRHSPHAVRLMIDAVGTYSVVDGERIPMESGDVVLTPGGSWHGHGHDGHEPAYWFDALDIPLVHLLEPMRYEEHPDRFAPIVSRADTSPYRFRSEDIQARLDAAPSAPDGTHGPKIWLDAPEMPSMGLTVERLASGTTTTPHRSNANRVFVVMDGSGTTTAGDTELTWSRGDTVVVPTWSTYHHAATSDATLFGVSDEPVMRALNYYRE